MKDSPCAITDECTDLGESAPEWSEEIDNQTQQSKSAASDAFSNADWESAAKHYTAAIKLQPSAMTIGKRAMCFLKLGCASAALRELLLLSSLILQPQTRCEIKT
jgi:uncharacterized protein HemY